MCQGSSWRDVCKALDDLEQRLQPQPPPANEKRQESGVIPEVELPPNGIYIVAYIVMAHTVMACILMTYIVMTYSQGRLRQWPI